MLAPTVTALRCLTIGAMLTLPVAPVCAQAVCTATPLAALFPSDGGAGEAVGYRVAMNAAGDRVVVGSMGHGHGGVQSGAAWVFADPGTPAQSESELVPVGAFADMRFASSLAMNAAGDVVVVGAAGTGAGAYNPRVYVFRFDGTGWVEEWHASSSSRDWFGSSVATNAAGDVLAAGAFMRDWGIHPNVGAVEVYRHQAGGWALDATVIPADSYDYNSVGYGVALSSDGNLLALSSNSESTWNGSGSVYLFEHAGGIWNQIAKLEEPMPAATGGFGAMLAFDGAAHTLAIGNRLDGRQVYMGGEVVIFSKYGSGWAFEARLLPQAPAVNGYLGYSLALNAAGDRLLAGMPGYVDSAGLRCGAVLEFERSANGWQTGNVYFGPNPAYNAGFGNSLGASVTGQRWIAGELGSSVHGSVAGMGHVFESPCTAPVVYCTAKTNSLGCVPQIAAQGTPSASSSSGFTISVANTRNHQHGMLFYGTNGRASVPWNGGTLCVQPPLMRTPIQNSGGTPAPTNDCSGAFAFDFNRWTAADRDPALFAGQHVRAQYYSRDPGASFQLNLTDAIEFLLEP